MVSSLLTFFLPLEYFLKLSILQHPLIVEGKNHIALPWPQAPLKEKLNVVQGSLANVFLVLLSLHSPRVIGPVEESQLLTQKLSKLI